MAVSTGRNACDKDLEILLTVLCDDVGAFLRFTYVNSAGDVSQVDTELDGVTPYVTTGTVTTCAAGGAAAGSDSEALQMCDSDGTPFLRHIVYSSSGLVTGVNDTEMDGTTAYVTVGNPTFCGASNRIVNTVTLCDDNGVFLRHINFDRNGFLVGSGTTDLAGGAYATSGTVHYCGEPVLYTLDDEGRPTSITGAATIPSDLRSFSIVVTSGPVTVDGITVQAGFSLSREAAPGETVPGFDVDATGGEIIFDGLKEV